MNWIRGSLIVIGGALPATALLWFAHVPLVAALSTIGEHPASALLVIGWFGLAAIGTLALWIAPFRPATTSLIAGLLAGLLAIGPFAFFVIRDWVERHGDPGHVTSLLVAGPTAVAIVLVTSFFSDADHQPAFSPWLMQLLGRGKRR